MNSSFLPPDEPPQDNNWLTGFRVRPMMLFTVSHILKKIEWSATFMRSLKATKRDERGFFRTKSVWGRLVYGSMIRFVWYQSGHKRHTLQYKTAPSASSSFTIWLWTWWTLLGSSSPSNVPIQPTYPIVVSLPFTWNWSFKLIGKPCNGPIFFPFFSKYSSSSFAPWSAWSKKISCKQLFWW